MRSLVQPGPASGMRIETLRGACTRMEFRLEVGLTLDEAICRPLIGIGARAATLRFAGAELEPFRYVMPGPSDGPAHVAYFSAPQAPAGAARIEIANVTFGYADGKAVLHCHAVWQEREAGRRGGHILLDQSVVAVSGEVVAWTFTDVGFRAEADAETNFTLLRPGRVGGGQEGDPDMADRMTQPERIGGGQVRGCGESKGGMLRSDLIGRGEQGRAVVARIRPNEDVCTAVETIARWHGMRDAIIRGSLGSLIGARFTDERAVADHATEVLVRSGEVRDGVATIDMVVVDMQGRVHEGRLVRGDNPVCITFDLVLIGTADTSAALGGIAL